jgi:hypothetical protein
MSNIPFQIAEAVHIIMEMEQPRGPCVTPTAGFSNWDFDEDEFEALVDSWALPPPLEDVQLFSPQPIADSDITYQGQSLAMLHDKDNEREKGFRSTFAMTCQIHKMGVKVQDSTGFTRSNRFLEASSDSATAPVFAQNENLLGRPKPCQLPCQQSPEVEKLQQMQGLHDIDHLQDTPREY